MKKIFEDIKRINNLDPASRSERLCKLFEESGELAQAVNKTIGRKTVIETEDELKSLICEEAADTIQCVLSLVDDYGITYDDIVKTIQIKNIKWENVANNRKK